ncbi:Miraculin [Bienertia sinuspersici]
MKHFLHLPILATTTLLLLLIHPIISTTNEDVLDIHGRPLIPGHNYYIVSSKDGGGFRWSLKKEFSILRPHYYVKPVDDYVEYGNYTTFIPKSSRQNTITVSSDLNIMFSDIKLPRRHVCSWRTSNYWKLAADSTTGMLFVSLEGSQGDEESMFKIEKHDVLGYKLRHCPSQPYAYGTVM